MEERDRKGGGGGIVDVKKGHIIKGKRINISRKKKKNKKVKKKIIRPRLKDRQKDRKIDE